MAVMIFPVPRTMTPGQTLSRRPPPCSPRAGATSRGIFWSSFSGARRLTISSATSRRSLPASPSNPGRFCCSASPAHRKSPSRRPTRRRQSRCSKSSTTICPSWSIRCSANSANAALDIRLLVHPVFTVERDEAGRLTAFKGTRKGEGRRESFIHIHIAGMDDAARARGDRARARRGPRRRARRRPGLAADAGARQRSRRRTESQSAAASGRRDRRSDPVSAMDRGRQFHPARRARLRLLPTAKPRSSRSSRPGSASCGRPRCGFFGAAISS